MKLAGVFLLALCLNYTAWGYAKKINISEKNASLDVVFKELKKQTNYTFLYTKEAISKANKVNIELVNASLDEALEKIFLTQPLNYIIFNQMVIIKDKTVAVIEVKDIDPVIIRQQQNYSLSGTVIDEKGETLPGVIVYISNSTYITSTDNAGKYNFDKIQPGNYEVVAKMIGFTVNVQNVIIENKSVLLNTKLAVSNTTLNTVTINGKADPNRKRYIDLFTRNFIGETQNAADCKILNPEVLDFDYDKKADVLRASADDFIIIENKSLGYRINYTLTMFRYSLRNNIYSATGYPYFEAMKGTVAQQKKWDNNRSDAYLGSKRHFISALKNKSVEKEGFSFFKQIKLGIPKPIDINNIVNFDAMDNDSTATMYSFYWNKKLVALFLRKKNPDGYLTGAKWATQRMADLTPVDYFVTPTKR